jgi:hypothetical protein
MAPSSSTSSPRKVATSLLVLVNGESALATTMAAVALLVMLLLATTPASTGTMHLGESALGTTMARDGSAGHAVAGRGRHGGRKSFIDKRRTQQETGWINPYLVVTCIPPRCTNEAPLRLPFPLNRMRSEVSNPWNWEVCRILVFCVQGTSVNNIVVISLNSTKVWATARVARDWKLFHGEISGFLFRGLHMHARNRKQESKKHTRTRNYISIL